MTNTSYLATSVEASRLRRAEQGEDFFHQADKAERRAYEVSQACAYWAPSMSAHWLGSDKFIVAILGHGRSFAEAFHLEKDKAFRSVAQLTPAVLYIRCLPPAAHQAFPERFVLEQVALAFMPF